jgi:hypothetical protein
MSTVQPVDEAQPETGGPSPWKPVASMASATILSLLFLASGIWKFTDLDATAERMIQSLVPVALSMPAAIAVAICEAFAGILLLVPRHRRWGAWISGLLLAAFMLYIGVLYDRLLGEDCNCFPWIRRVVGPVFFAGDAAMLALAAVAGWWSRTPHGRRHAATILGCVCLAAGVSYAASAILRSRADAPEIATVDGKPLHLRQGRVLLYFFDPECMHCYAVAQEMSKRKWGGTRIVLLPTREQRYARAFSQETGLHAGVSPDADSLRRVFVFTDPPFAVALDRGRTVATFNSGEMELETYYLTLKRLGHLVESPGQREDRR